MKKKIQLPKIKKLSKILKQIAQHHCETIKLNLFPNKAYIGGKWVDSVGAKVFNVSSIYSLSYWVGI